MPEPSESRGAGPVGDAPVRRAAAILLGMAAHDLRTPLNGMAGWLQVLTSGKDLPPTIREHALKGLQSAVAQQVMLADALSQVSQIESGQIEMQITVVDVGAVLQAVLPEFVREADSRAVALQVTQAEKPACLNADGGLIAALLRYLIAGALKFSAKDSVLAVTVAPGMPGQGCSIHLDLGKSFLPAEAIDTLLQYLRGAEPARPAGAGAAFGLAVAQKLILFLGGQLEVAAGTAPQRVILLARLPDSDPKPE